MSVSLLALSAFALFALGYRFYARFVGERIFRDQDEFRTPAYEHEDGKDFVPTGKHVLFGHHFTSIAGAAPIIGPCIAAYWGVLPALLWVVLGTIFIGAVHDFGALVLSVREGGRTIADIAGRVITPRVRLMFLSFVMVLSWLVVAVFALAIAGLFVSMPSSVLAVNLEIIVALAIGWLIYKRNVRLLWPSLIALALLYGFIALGQHYPVSFTAAPGSDDSILALGWSKGEATRFWLFFLFAYAVVASLLPVWLLLQPRDYINSHQLFVGLAMLFLGIFMTGPRVDAPWIRLGGDDAPPIVPFLFVTVACGAISGFHSMVASGTTSKQLKSLKHARAIGYGSMLGEASLAVASVLAAVAGIALYGPCDDLPAQGSVPRLDWMTYYDSFPNAAKNGPQAFVLGGAAFLRVLGIPDGFATTMMAVLVVSFAATTLDTAARIQRFIVGEFGAATGLRILTNRYVGTVIAIAPAVLIAFSRVIDPETGRETSVAMRLWPIFGASNQMLAALTLMVLAIYFWRRRRPVLPLLIPMLLVTTIAVTALLLQTGEFIDKGNSLLVGLCVLMLTLVVWMLVEGAMVFRRSVGSREDVDEHRGGSDP